MLALTSIEPVLNRMLGEGWPWPAWLSRYAGRCLI